MARSGSGERFEVTLSTQSVRLLHLLATKGLYGRSAAEVGGRLLERALEQFVEPPKVGLDQLAEVSERPTGDTSKT